jgi:uncharacterized protein YhbP (UPF0306 family)
MRAVARPRIERAAFRLLDASRLCAIATMSPRATAHVSTVYFVRNQDLDVFWLSDPAARHSRNIRARPSTAIAVYDSHQVWGKPDRGIQLFGTASQLPAKESAYAESLYVARFSGHAAHDLGAYRFYQFRTDRLKVFDETQLGAGVFVTAAIIHTGRRLVWERTDISGGADSS